VCLGRRGVGRQQVSMMRGGIERGRCVSRIWLIVDMGAKAFGGSLRRKWGDILGWDRMRFGCRWHFRDISAVSAFASASICLMLRVPISESFRCEDEAEDSE